MREANPQGLKPLLLGGVCGTTGVVPFPFVPFPFVPFPFVPFLFVPLPFVLFLFVPFPFVPERLESCPSHSCRSCSCGRERLARAAAFEKHERHARAHTIRESRVYGSRFARY